MLAIGTRPAAAHHPFSKILTGGAAYAQVHAARPDDPITHKRTWPKANPSLDHMPVLERRLRRELEEAKADPALLLSFLALRLNLGMPDVQQAALVEASSWERIEDPEAEERFALGTGYVLGIDLGSGSAMSAASAYVPATGSLRVFAVFPELPDLATLGLRDGVGKLYQEMAEQKELLVIGRRVASIDGLL